MTNPTSTAIFKILLCLKTRNAILISPHPGAKRCTCEAARLLAEAAYAAGAPDGIIACLAEPTQALSEAVMASVDTVLATGGPGLIQAAYSSGTPAIGAGSGNCPSIVDETADLKNAVYSTLHSKTFDNRDDRSSEQSVVVVGDANLSEGEGGIDSMECTYLTADEIAKVKPLILDANGALSSEIVGKKAVDIARLAGIEVPKRPKCWSGKSPLPRPVNPLPTKNCRLCWPCIERLPFGKLWNWRRSWSAEADWVIPPRFGLTRSRRNTSRCGTPR